jgi:hypothetical protein
MTVASTIILELQSVLTTLALACIVNYDCKLTLQIVVSIRIVTYDRNSFITQVTVLFWFWLYDTNGSEPLSNGKVQYSLPPCAN